MASKASKPAAPPKAAALKSVPTAAPLPDTATLPVVAQAAPTPSIADPSDEAAELAAPKGDAYKLKELISAVTEKTGAKKKDTKELVEAVLAEMARVLGRGQSLSLPPLGNIRVAKTEDRGGAQMLVLKLRLGGGPLGGEGEGGGAKGAKQALAEDGEDS
jgi:DNA-binding protein HU-alpha